MGAGVGAGAGVGVDVGMGVGMGMGMGGGMEASKRQACGTCAYARTCTCWGLCCGVEGYLNGGARGAGWELPAEWAGIQKHKIQALEKWPGHHHDNLMAQHHVTAMPCRLVPGVAGRRDELPSPGRGPWRSVVEHRAEIDR